MNIGKTIAELRTARGMSQQQLADSLFVSRDLVAKWESGRRRPDYTMIEAAAALFGVSADSIADKNSLVFEELEECVGENCGISEEKLCRTIELFLKKNNPTESGMFIRRYYFLESTSEIARRYGVGENHVRSLLSRTRRKLRLFVKERKE